VVLDDTLGSLLGFATATLGAGFSSTTTGFTSSLGTVGLAVLCLDGDFLVRPGDLGLPGDFGRPGDFDRPRLLDLAGTFLPGDRERPRLAGDFAGDGILSA